MTVNTLPTSAEVVSGTQTNAQQKVDFASMLDFILQQLGAKSGQGPQTVASAGTLNLDAVTDTRDIVISGTTAITAVTIEAGKVFRCRASGAFTLTNNSAIVTQRGASIVCVAGDTFMMRATAVNTVEILNFTRIQDPVGLKQTWQNMTGSRATATPYTNTTGQAIQITINATMGTAGNGALLTVDGVALYGVLVASNSTGSYVSAIIPAGSVYTLTATGGTISIDRWNELRA